MKQFKHLIGLFTIVILLQSCIGKDFVNDAIDPVVRINTTNATTVVGETFQFNATYFNNVGQPETATILWSSSNEAIATIDVNGLATAITEGTTTIKATVVIEGNLVIEDTIEFTVDTVVVDPLPIVRTGSIQTTSGYNLQGDFVFEEILDMNLIRLSFDGTYNASSNLPGLYLYLSNNPNSINGAYNAGPVSVFNGAHLYEFNDIDINDYNYLLYWCEPFGVKVGDGQIN